MNTDGANQEINAALRTLLRGLTQNNLKEIYAGHKALYKIGAPTISYIRDAIHQSNWTKLRYSNEIRYITGLVSILHDIDESESKGIANQFKQNGCDVSVAHLLNSVCRFTVSDYLQYEIRGIRIFEHKKLEIKQPVQPRLEDWLKNAPEEDLVQIERIYILRKGDLKALGTYTPILCNINLVWDNPCSNSNPLSYLNLYIIENTLYHEIGHHIHRHKFGQDEKQEKEARDYADYIMRISNHLQFRIIRGIFGSPPHPFEKRKMGG
jgi:hypothetical protein